jgi:hypothetical protein
VSYARGRTEFLFLFNDRSQALAAAEAARERGYDSRLLPGDGEGRNFQVRLALNRVLADAELKRTVLELRLFMADYRGRFEGCGIQSFET